MTDPYVWQYSNLVLTFCYIFQAKFVVITPEKSADG